MILLKVYQLLVRGNMEDGALVSDVSFELQAVFGG